MATLQEYSQLFLINPLFELLKYLYIHTGSLGFAIIIFTVAIRTLLVPLTLPMMRSQKKMKAIRPELVKLRKKHGKDNAAFQKAQLELLKEHNISPVAGFVPYILQLVVIIALYSVLRTFVERATGLGLSIETHFLGLDLAKPDPSYVLPVVAAATQFVLSLMLLPGIEKHDLVPDNSSNKKTQEKNAKETDAQEMAETMQKQMMFMMPIMTGIIAISFPAGLGLYWIVMTVFSIAQQWITSGPGGLASTLASLKQRFSK